MPQLAPRSDRTPLPLAQRSASKPRAPQVPDGNDPRGVLAPASGTPERWPSRNRTARCTGGRATPGWALLALVLGTTACDGKSPEASAHANSGPGAAAVTAPADGRVKVAVGEYGYTPATIAATAGNPLTLEFLRTTDQGCGGEVVFPERNIHRKLPVGETVEITFTPASTGRIAFTCGMGMYEGAILVSEGK